MDRLDKWDEKLQSEVITANLDKPMLLTDYARLPEHLQKEYITKLRRHFRARIPEIAQVMGCSEESAAGILERAGMASTDRGFKARSREQEDAWKLFLGTWGKAFDFSHSAKPQKEAEGGQSEGQSEDCSLIDCVKQQTVPVIEEPKVEARLRSFAVDLAGPLDAVLRRIVEFREIVGALAVRITVRIDEED